MISVIIGLLVVAVVFMVYVLFYDLKREKYISLERKKFIKLLGCENGDIIESHLKLLNASNVLFKDSGNLFSIAMIRSRLNTKNITPLFLEKHDNFFLEIIDCLIESGLITYSKITNGNHYFALTDKGKEVAEYASNLLFDAKLGAKARLALNWNHHND